MTKALLYDPARDLRVEIIDDSSEFMWTEGNYACDCNRRLFIARKLGEPEPAEDRCGSTIILERLEIDGVQVGPPA